MIVTKIEIIDGHRYLVTRENGVMVKKEGRDPSVPVADPEKDAALLLANKSTTLTLAEIGKLVQFLVKRQT